MPFTLYKANWNQEDKFVYIAGKRLVNRTRKIVDVQVFSKWHVAELYVKWQSVWGCKPVHKCTGMALYWIPVRIELRSGTNMERTIVYGYVLFDFHQARNA